MTEENPKPYTVIQKMIPLDLLVVGKDDSPDGWYRIPSWRVEFEALKGFDLRVHKAMSPSGWAISEGSTGHKIYQGWGDDEFEPETSSDVLEEFVKLMLPKLDHAKMETAIAKARVRLAELPPCPFTQRPEVREQEPPKGLLVSIALRLDHGLFATPPYAPPDRKRYIEVALADRKSVV